MFAIAFVKVNILLYLQECLLYIIKLDFINCSLVVSIFFSDRMIPDLDLTSLQLPCQNIIVEQLDNLFFSK